MIPTPCATDPLTRIRIGRNALVQRLRAGNLTPEEQADIQKGISNLSQLEEIFSEEYVKKVTLALGHEPTRNEVVIYYVCSGDAANFRAHP